MLNEDRGMLPDYVIFGERMREIFPQTFKQKPFKKYSGLNV